uniref:Uncharacterized protein n=1 Tax=Arundo donax TaxID=35708 RepID=A0A0A9A838_ARUDO
MASIVATRLTINSFWKCCWHITCLRCPQFCTCYDSHSVICWQHISP